MRARRDARGPRRRRRRPRATARGFRHRGRAGRTPPRRRDLPRRAPASWRRRPRVWCTRRRHRPRTGTRGRLRRRGMRGLPGSGGARRVRLPSPGSAKGRRRRDWRVPRRWGRLRVGAGGAVGAGCWPIARAGVRRGDPSRAARTRCCGRPPCLRRDGRGREVRVVGERALSENIFENLKNGRTELLEVPALSLGLLVLLAGLAASGGAAAPDGHRLRGFGPRLGEHSDAPQV